MKKTIKSLCAALLAVTLIGFTPAWAADTSDQADISAQELIEEIDYIAQEDADATVENNVDMANLAIQLSMQADAMTDSQLIEKITSEDTGEGAKEVYIQLLGHQENYRVNENDLMQMVADDTVSNSVKTNILSVLDFTSEDSIIYLKNLSDDDADSVVSFRALIELWQDHPEEALDIATDILEQGFADNEQTRAAITIFGAAVRTQLFEPTEEQQRWFIQGCQSVLDISVNDKIKDSVALALSDLGTYDSLNAIVTSDNIDHLFKESIFLEQQEKLTANEISELSRIAEFTAANSSYFACAVYRDGVALGQWHTGIITGSSSTSSNYIVHHPGSGYVQYTDLAGFRYETSNTIKGYFKPNVYMSDSKKSSVTNTAKRLVALDIPYTVFGQVGYSAVNNGRIVEPEDVGTMRCDGVVEYSYEYNGVRICGGNTNWNVSIDRTENMDAHGANTVTPEVQSENMTRV